jgi:mercuric ion transport protein
MANPTVELVYEASCPNIAAARAHLLRAFEAAGCTARWTEWELSRRDAPAHVRGYGSPTVLVNSTDVTGEAPAGTDDCCRLYAASHGQAVCGAPPVAAIAAALRRAAAVTD